MRQHLVERSARGYLIQIILEGLVQCVAHKRGHARLLLVRQLLQVFVKVFVHVNKQLCQDDRLPLNVDIVPYLYTYIIMRKFCSSCLPGLVRIDSGWNCTPDNVNSLWRTPMITPDSDRAVTSSTSGSVSGTMAREW